MKKYSTQYPGVYTDTQQNIMDALAQKCREINERGEVDIQSVVNGTIDPSIPGVEKTMTVSKKEMMFWVKYDPENRLYWDKEYAAKTRFGNVIAFPTLPSQGCHFYGKLPSGLGDELIVNGLCQSRTFYRPVYEGDELYLIMDRIEYRDMTPSEGSKFRTIMSSGSGKVYNQNGDLVMEGHGRCKENLSCFADPKDRPEDGNPIWRDPDWQSRPVHRYSDKDWDYIRSIWAQEPKQSEQHIFFEDVEVGTELPPVIYGPISSPTSDPLFYIPVEAAYLKKNILDSDTFMTMVRDEYDGVYRTPEEAYRLPTPEERFKERAIFENSLARQLVAKALINWAGESGWLRKIDWRIMRTLPDEDCSVIPDYDDWPNPLDRVPGMKGKYANIHGLAGDVCLIHAVVSDKYTKNNENIVDITWWCTTIDDEIFEEGTALVLLPTKENKE